MPETVIFSRASSTRLFSSMCMAAIEVMPRMAFMGVRMSWLMRERKSLLARLAASARDTARASICCCSSSRRITSSMLRMAMVMAVSLPFFRSASVTEMEHHS